MPNTATQNRLILVAGASGYVANRLIPHLLESGFQVRCMVRNASKIRARPWADRVEIVTGNILDPTRLDQIVEGVTAAYYFIHSMSSGRNYRNFDRQGAHNFGTAARRAGVKQIIYLGGLGHTNHITRHIQSRQETGEILRQSGVPVTEFRASVIIGTGSISFEMIRFITEWLPVIPTPTATNVLGQPIAIRDLLKYLQAALFNPGCMDKVFEIGGVDLITYPEMLAIYARNRGLQRSFIPVPFFNASFYALFADRFTPVPFSIARPLMEELVTESIVRNKDAENIFSSIEPTSYSDSVAQALERKDYGNKNIYWSNRLVTRRPLIHANVRTSGEGFLIDHRQQPVHSAAPDVLKNIEKILQSQWILDGFQPDHWIRLLYNKRLPGKLWLEVAINTHASVNTISQTALFEPRGLGGFLYWYGLQPINSLRFSRLFSKLLSLDS